MIDSKRLTAISLVSVVLAVLICAVLTILAYSPAAETLSVTSEPLYAEKIFGAEIIRIDISADEADWQEMLDNAMSEEYIMADIAVNGTKFSNVGIRPKGNNSLQQVASSDSDRYSFKIKFDEYADGQTCFGLDMLVLNDMLGDASCMKEYTTFDMMREMGVETPYFGYAMITLNGEDWGLYFALEAYNDSYKQRVSGDVSGKLYNVKMSAGGGFGSSSPENGFPERPERDFPAKGEKAEKAEAAENLGENGFSDRFGKGGGMGFMGGMGASTNGGSLIYTDDEISSYSAIFENAVGKAPGEEDCQRVITALKALNEGADIEKYFDVDEILRYLAVHTVVVNLDSYSSGMAQNYYIYECGGVLQILPWDYNYAWGAFQSGSASDVVNFPIDTPVSGVEMSERPLIAKLFENEEYLERYHGYLRELVENYFTNGKFNDKVDELDNLISAYVQKDPTAFYTYEEYQTALAAFKTLGNLRAESVLGQLDGAVPSTTEGQKAAPDRLIDASAVKLSELGSGGFGGFGDFENFEGKDGNRQDRPDNEPGAFPESDMPDMFGSFPAGFGAEEEPPGFSGRGNGENPPSTPNGGFDSPEAERGTERRGAAFPSPDNADETGSRSLAAVGICAGASACAVFGASLVKRKF